MGYIQSFERYETKYLISSEQAERFAEKACAFIDEDSYGSYTVCNIYLDTDDYYFITHSLDHPVYKEKLRIRSYGSVKDNDLVYFEIKKKFGGVVYKRRISVKESEALDFALNQVKPSGLTNVSDRQILSEIEYLINTYSPKPKLYLAYDRKAYSSKHFPMLRITFDSGIRWRCNDVTLHSNDHGDYLDTGISDYRLMEIKSFGAIPIEITGILSELGIYPTSFSKYGEIFRQCIYMQTKDRKDLLNNVR